MIIVKITKTELLKLDNNVSVIQYILNKLRANGIPVKGILQYDGLEKGNIREDRLVTNDEVEVTYTWWN